MLDKNKWNKGQVAIRVAIGLLLFVVLAIFVIPMMAPVGAKILLEGRGYVVFAAGEYSNIEDKLDTLQADVGAGVMGRAVTDTLHISPDGSGTDGFSWGTAYTTIQDALDAASTDADDLTLILISPHTTYYDIDTTGDPTWEANVILLGSHRNFVSIRNTHASATSILKLTGKSAVINLTFHLGTGSGNGLIMTRGGCRVYSVFFNGASLTGAATALWLDGDSKANAKAENIYMLGHVSYMTGLKVDQFTFSHFKHFHIHKCLTGIQAVGANSDENQFANFDIGNCAIGLDLDAGNEQHFKDVTFHGNTTNVDDEVGDHNWTAINGAFPIALEPENLVGTQVDCGAAGVYGADTEIRAVADNAPFRIVGVHVEPSASEWYELRFSDDSGATFYDTLLFDGTKREGIAAPSGTEYIFNKGTRISASVRSESGGNNVTVWIEIQEI